MPNFVEIAHTVREICQFSIFQNVGRRLLGFVKLQILTSNWVGWTEVCSQERISLITNSFLMILLSYSNSSIKGTKILGLNNNKHVHVFLFYHRPFLEVCSLDENLLFSTLILGSVFSDYVLFTGIYFSRFDTIPACDGQMDTESHHIQR